MPRKIRELRAELARAGFRRNTKRGKGSHTWWEHPTGVVANIPGKDGDDAKQYLEKHVRGAITKAEELERRAREAGAKRKQQNGQQP